MLLSLADYFFNCPIKKTFGIDCFGCGFQRSFGLLVEGKLIESIQMYPALLPLLFMWFFAALHLYFKFKNGARVIQVLFIFCALIILINYIYKLTHGYST